MLQQCHCPISHINKNLSINVLAKACLDGINNDTCMESYCVEKLCIVLPINMAKKFQHEFISGLFQRWIITKPPRNLSSFGDSKDLVHLMWLWKDGKYYL